MPLFEADPRLPPVEERPHRLMDHIPKQLRSGVAVGLNRGWAWMRAEVDGLDVTITLVTDREDEPNPTQWFTTVSGFVILTDKGPMRKFWAESCKDLYQRATHRQPVWCAEWDDYDRFYYNGSLR